MVRALAERGLLNLHDVVSSRAGDSATERLVGVFDDIAATLVISGNTYPGDDRRDVRKHRLRRSPRLRPARHFLGAVKDGVADGDISARHDPQTLADIIVGALFGGLMNWTGDKTYSLKTGLHDMAVALTDLLGADR